ncbi:hypothetical protein ABVK25_001046 [Lepraria finkii]|uniref:RNase III domain-containing protein n=1 Tax=Lepraria finkii TaxID=1340010 RepID=A0ABR4BKU0_9LECA
MATIRRVQNTIGHMTPTVRKLQNILGYKFNNAQYLWEAVQAPGSIIRSGEISGAGTIRHSAGWQRFPDGNRRLAVLGDTVLKLALVEDWYKGDEVRERLSRVVSDIGSNANLDRIGRNHGLEKLINNNPSQEYSEIGALTMATTVEAIIGAVYLDSGTRSVPLIMQNLGLMPKMVRRTAFDSRRFDKATESSDVMESTQGSEKLSDEEAGFTHADTST